MANDLTDRGPPDRICVDKSQDWEVRYWEVRYWTRKFGCTATELRDAVRAVGTMADRVQTYLKNQKR